MTSTVLAVPAQPPELWIRLQVRRQEGNPVTLIQMMRNYRRDEDTITRMMAALVRDRRVRRVTDTAGQLIGWTA